MRIVQVISPTATMFERKLQRVDFAGLSPDHDVTCVTVAGRRSPVAGDAVQHVYGADSRIARPKRSWFSRETTIHVSPVERHGFAIVPEAVEDRYWDVPATGDRQPATVGCVLRKPLKNIIEQTMVRVHRTREDIEWLTFDEMPAPEELVQVDVWIDPAIDEHDYDGCVAEALVCGLPVVASRTAINAQRLEKGRTGLLVPLNDPNELTHAILSALFKPEVAQQKIEAARQTVAKFRPRQRLRVLTSIYESLHQ